MENGMIIFLTVIICIITPSLFLYWLTLRKKNHLEKIETDWIRFSKAINNNHIEGIIKYGKEVIWNEHFSMIKLKEMSKLIDEFENKNIVLRKEDELKELKLLIYNKYLDWNIEYPFFG
ncbi:hypothetical protein [Tenacibaculum sp. 190524A05c]|jgi:hypothetical protein|uniref:Uncharacterized protein n=1 Tax=Tenacibaculum platacis TaxID=3137852 RepID=A0ABM9P051_9FLAO